MCVAWWLPCSVVCDCCVRCGESLLVFGVLVLLLCVVVRRVVAGVVCVCCGRVLLAGACVVLSVDTGWMVGLLLLYDAA